MLFPAFFPFYGRKDSRGFFSMGVEVVEVENRVCMKEGRRGDAIASCFPSGSLGSVLEEGFYREE